MEKNIIRCFMNSRIFEFWEFTWRNRRKCFPKGLYADIRKSYVKYHWTLEEFFSYGYESLCEIDRARIVPIKEQVAFSNYLNPYSVHKLLRNKWNTYLHFKNFYHRACCVVRNEQDIENLSCFLNDNTRFIVKPLNGAMGKNVKIIDTYVNPISYEKILMDYPKGAIVEQLIQQDPRMAELHPQSVNTVRMTSFRMKDGVDVKFAFLRMGCGTSIVDNAAAGGILALVDVKTGIVVQAISNAGEEVYCHPDSGKQIVGFQVPKWNDAVDYTKTLANALPEAKYVGWDIALTENGWVMIEGNSRGGFGWHDVSKIDIRKEVDEYIQSFAPNETLRKIYYRYYIKS